jgi:hypothetical protein
MTVLEAAPCIDTEFIDYAFRPRIPHDLGYYYTRYLEAVGMPTWGRPAPTLNGTRAAIWTGRNPDYRGEVPTLAVVTENDTRVINKQSTWFVGIAQLELINQQVPYTHSIAPREALLLEATAHGGNHQIRRALDLMMDLHHRDL